MIGSTVSTKGGLSQAFACAEAWNCTAFQIYVTNSRTWNVCDIKNDVLLAFKANWEKSQVVLAVGHASLLLNIASADAEIREKSAKRLILEALISKKLGLSTLVFHPGSNIDKEQGYRYAGATIRRVMRCVPDINLSVENTAGQGNFLCATFSELRHFLNSAGNHSRLKVCFDTCHAFAADYPLDSNSGYYKTMSEFERTIGLDKISVFHVNDSRVAKGSRVDRHADYVGAGYMGIHPFKALLSDMRFMNIPMIVEAPKGDEKSLVSVRLLNDLRRESAALLTPQQMSRKFVPL